MTEDSAGLVGVSEAWEAVVPLTLVWPVVPIMVYACGFDISFFGDNIF
jgi:hypothetical protein